MFFFACATPEPGTVDDPASSAGVDSAVDPPPDSDSGTDSDSADTDTDSDSGDTDTDTGPPPPEVESAEATTLPVPTAVGLPEVVGFTVNARLQPHGRPATWRVDYGPTEAYGSTTADRALPGKLDAWFVEEWDENEAAWKAGIGGAQLAWAETGGWDGGPYVQYSDDGSAGNDTNHYDGIGIIHLGLYGYIGHFDDGGVPPLYLGGGFPDLRGAELSMWLRGRDWEPATTEIGSWIQGYRDITAVEVVPEDSRYPNWAWTADPLSAHLASGDWELAEWTLRNRSQDWTFAGANGGRLLYDYGELDNSLSHVNVDFFPIQILYVDLVDQPSGGIDYDRLSIRYRQHNLLAASNGGFLVQDPGGTGVETLTDGWRHGEGHEWRSEPDPSGEITMIYGFTDPVTVWSVTVHNSLENPTETVAVDVSSDGGVTWWRAGGGPLEATGAPNLRFHHDEAWELVDGVATWTPLHPDPVDRIRFTLTSGWQDGAWGLGELEVFGTGAQEQTEDDWYDVNQDILVEPGTWHYRVSVSTDAGSVSGPDQVVTVE